MEGFEAAEEDSHELAAIYAEGALFEEDVGFVGEDDLVFVLLVSFRCVERMEVVDERYLPQPIISPSRKCRGDSLAVLGVLIRARKR